MNSSKLASHVTEKSIEACSSKEEVESLLASSSLMTKELMSKERSKPSRMEAQNEGQQRKMVVAEQSFQDANRLEANSWVAAFTPDASNLPLSAREPWVIARAELLKERMIHARIRREYTALPFEHWLEDVQEVERAVYGKKQVDFVYDSCSKQDESATRTLIAMDLTSNRGLINRQDKE